MIPFVIPPLARPYALTNGVSSKLQLLHVCHMSVKIDNNLIEETTYLRIFDQAPHICIPRVVVFL